MTDLSETIPDDIQTLAEHIARNYGDDILIAECTHSIAHALLGERRAQIERDAVIAEQEGDWGPVYVEGKGIAHAIRAEVK